MVGQFKFCSTIFQQKQNISTTNNFLSPRCRARARDNEPKPEAHAARETELLRGVQDPEAAPRAPLPLVQRVRFEDGSPLPVDLQLCRLKEPQVLLLFPLPRHVRHRAGRVQTAAYL